MLEQQSARRQELLRIRGLDPQKVSELQRVRGLELQEVREWEPHRVKGLKPEKVKGQNCLRFTKVFKPTGAWNFTRLLSSCFRFGVWHKNA